MKPVQFTISIVVAVLQLPWNSCSEGQTRKDSSPWSDARLPRCNLVNPAFPPPTYLPTHKSPRTSRRQALTVSTPVVRSRRFAPHCPNKPPQSHTLSLRVPVRRAHRGVATNRQTSSRPADQKCPVQRRALNPPNRPFARPQRPRAPPTLANDGHFVENIPSTDDHINDRRAETRSFRKRVWRFFFHIRNVGLAWKRPCGWTEGWAASAGDGG